MSDIVENSYQRYKSLTKIWLTWLVETAQGREQGSAENDRTARSKRRATKKRRAKHSGGVEEITVSGLLRLAESISQATDLGPEVPLHILRCIEDTIAGRKECAAWYARKESPPGSDLEKQHEGHRHFINVLEQILSLLRRRATKQTTPKMHKEQKAHDKIPKEPTQPQTDINILFSHLAVEEPAAWDASQQHSNPPESSQSKRTTSKKTSKRTTSKKTYKLEDQEDDVDFAVYCHFRDLYSIREYIREQWLKFAAGEASLETVAFTTNAAFGMMRRSEQELNNAHPHLIDYECMLAHGKTTHSRIPKECAASSASVTPQPKTVDGLHDFAGSQAYDVLCKCQAAVRQIRIDKGNCKVRVTTRSLDGDNEDSESIHDVRTAQNHLGVMLGEAAFLGLIDYDTLFGDDLLRGMTLFLKTNEIKSWFVAACQATIDIFCCLSTRPHCAFQALQVAASHAKTVIDSYFNYPNGMIYHDRPGIFHPYELGLLTTKAIIHFWVEKDALAEAKASTGAEGYTAKPFDLLKSHPILCGLLANHIKLRLYEDSIEISNLSYCTLNVAHLYNAMRHTKKLPQPWEEMDGLIDLQGADHLFVGNMPTMQPQFASKILLAMGIGITTLSKDFQCRLKGDERLASLSKRGPRQLRTNSLLLQLSEQPEVQKHLDINWTKLMDFVGLMLEKCVKITQSKNCSTAMRMIAKDWQNTKTLSQVQLLSALCQTLREEEAHMNFDYLSVIRRCKAIMSGLARSPVPDKTFIPRHVSRSADGEYPVIFCHAILMDHQSRGTILDEAVPYVRSIVEPDIGEKEIEPSDRADVPAPTSTGSHAHRLDNSNNPGPLQEELDNPSVSSVELLTMINLIIGKLRNPPFPKGPSFQESTALDWAVLKAMRRGGSEALDDALRKREQYYADARERYRRAHRMRHGR